MTTAPEHSPSQRARAQERIAAYHTRKQEQLLRPVADLLDRYRQGEADVWQVDAAIYAYQKATQELYILMSTFYKSSVPLHFMLEFLEREERGEDPWQFLVQAAADQSARNDPRRGRGR